MALYEPTAAPTRPAAPDYSTFPVLDRQVATRKAIKALMAEGVDGRRAQVQGVQSAPGSRGMKAVSNDLWRMLWDNPFKLTPQQAFHSLDPIDQIILCQVSDLWCQLRTLLGDPVTAVVPAGYKLTIQPDPAKPDFGVTVTTV